MYLLLLQHFRQALNDSGKCSLSKSQSKSLSLYPQADPVHGAVYLSQNKCQQDNSIQFKVLLNKGNTIKIVCSFFYMLLMNKDESLKYFMKNCIYLSKHQIFLFPCLLTNLMALNNKQGRTYCSSFPINLRKLLTIICTNSTEDLSRVIYFILVFFLENNYIRKCNIFKKLCE